MHASIFTRASFGHPRLKTFDTVRMPTLQSFAPRCIACRQVRRTCNREGFERDTRRCEYLDITASVVS